MAKILFANNAQSSLAGSITNVATTANLAAGSGALFPNPGAGEYFVGTFTDAATGLLREIVHVTAKSGDTITMVRAQEGTTALNWAANDLFAELWTAGQAAAMIQEGQGRIRLTANLDVYVAATGSDSNTGLTIGSPFLTLQHAADFVAENYDLAGFSALVHVADGTYTAGVDLFDDLVGNLSEFFGLRFIGNLTTPSACVINSSTECFAADGNATFSISGFKLQTSGPVNSALNCAYGGLIAIEGNCEFGTTTNDHIGCFAGGQIVIQAGYTISGAANRHWAIDTNSWLVVDQSQTITLTGTPAFGIFAEVSDCSVLITEFAVFSGSATGTRYRVSENAVINTNGGGANFLPGNVAGSSVTGGQYV